MNTHCLANLGSEPTFFYRNGCSQLDLILSSKPDKCLRFNQLGLSGMSNHDLVFASFDYDTDNLNDVFCTRNYKRINPEQVLREFENIDWEFFYNNRDPDTLTEFFNTNVKQLFSTCVPLKVVRRKSRNNPWFNVDIERAIIESNLLHRQWKSSKTEHDYILFKRKRNTVTSLINKARKNY